MKLSIALASSMVLAVAALTAQTANTVDAHLAAAKAAAGTDHLEIYNELCNAPAPAPAAPRPAQAAPRAAQPPGPPPQSQWHRDPVQVFDNLYYLGQSEYSAWA